MKKRILTLVFLASVFLLGACSSNETEDKVLVKTKNGEITYSELEKVVMTRYSENTLKELIIKDILEEKYQIEEGQVESVIAEQKSYYETEEQFENEVLNKGFGTMEEFKNSIKTGLLFEKALNDIEVTEKILKEYYEENEETFTEVRASHILVSSNEKAEEVLKEVEAGKDFSELAKKHSEGPSAESGGDLGFFAKGEMIKEFEEVVFGMEVGQTSEIVKTEFGYHIIKLHEKIEKDLENHYSEIEEKYKKEHKLTPEELIQKILTENEIEILDDMYDKVIQ